MNISLVSIYVGGILFFLMGIFHTQFFKLFKWKKDFERITGTNQRVFYTIHIALLLLFFGFSYISIYYAKELSESIGIAFGINVVLSLFWIWRTIWQIIYFKPDKKSKLLFMHYVLITIFFLLFASYCIPVILNYFK